MPERAVPHQFTARTTAAIARAMAADARRAARSRKALVWGGGAAAIVAAYFGAGPALSVFSTALVAALDLMIRSIVWVVDRPHLSVWSALNGVGRATGGVHCGPEGHGIMFTIQATRDRGIRRAPTPAWIDREFLE